MKKEDIKIVIAAILIILAVVGLVTLIHHHTTTSAHQKMLDQKVELLMEHLTPEWKCISVEGGFNEAHMQYEYTFTFMIRGIANHAIYAYAYQEDLTEETIDHLERIEDDGFVYTPEKSYKPTD